MGGLARTHRAWGLPEGDLEGLQWGEGSLFPGPLAQVEEPISGGSLHSGVEVEWRLTFITQEN